MTNFLLANGQLQTAERCSFLCDCVLIKFYLIFVGAGFSLVILSIVVFKLNAILWTGKPFKLQAVSAN